MRFSKVGSIVYATNQGLGILAKDFYDNGVLDTVLVQNHSSYESHPEWYPNRVGSEDELLSQIDTLLLFETPFNWKIIPKAREMGIKVILMPMYECTPYPLPYSPDLLLCPSELDFDHYARVGERSLALITVPVDVKWKLRKKARIFVHNAGNGGLGFRNGTPELIEAMKYVKSPIKLIIRTQRHDFKCNDPRVEIRRGTVPYNELWNEGDVFIFPEKFNGLSLPLQEAFASGMLVMCGDRFPMNTWLPNEPLIPVKGYKKERISVEFDSAIYDPKEIAKTIDSWYDKDIIKYSEMGREWGEANSWANLKADYIKICNH